MFKFIVIYIVILTVYILFLKVYEIVALRLKQRRLKNNYVIDKILLSSKVEFNLTDGIVVLIISYIVYKYPL
ncbi:hypothetical protein CW718_11970 [Macrococcoides caseolyticum]|nr:hypothetical protein CW718_11970 [Macrococcus caseolyticus]